MERHDSIRDELSNLLEPAKPCPDAVGAWQDANGDEFIVYDNRFTDLNAVDTDERYSVGYNGGIEALSSVRDVIGYVEEEADIVEESEDFSTYDTESELHTGPVYLE